MQPYLITFSIIITSLAFVHIPKILCQDQQYVTCGEPFWCGNLSFTYPFWGGNRPSSCGYPGFELTCQTSVAILTFEPLRYRVLTINHFQRSVTVARDDLWNNLCPPSFLYNDTFDSDILSYSSDYPNVTLSYDCTILITNFKRPLNQFECDKNSTPSFYSTDEIGFDPTEVECNINMSVPVDQVAYSNLGGFADLQEALTDGFGLRWKANNQVCEQCTRSGGRCGYDNSSTSSFVCYCSDGPYDLVCNTRNYIGLTALSDSPAPSSLPHPPGPSAFPDPPGPSASPVSPGPSVFPDPPGPSRPPDPPPAQRDNPDGHGRLNLRLILGILFGILGLSLSAAGVYYLVKKCSSSKGTMWWEQDKEYKQNVEAFMRNFGSPAPKYYSYSEIKRMTNSFADQLGQGGYGSVYKGNLSDGRQVAVKVLRDGKGNGEDFINEVASISRTSHVNVVTLLGFCYEPNRRALVYDFMSNGSLDKFICRNEPEDASRRLEWDVLYQIAVGTARGLEYLHQGCNTRIVHFDIKPQNILLDDDFCPKISDFGLARLCKKKPSILSTMGARGTVGYIAPEMVFRGFGGVSHKSDIYSYGMMVLEMVGLKSRIHVDTERSSETYFPNWIYDRLELEMDLGLEGIMNAEEEEAAMKMILVGLWCIQTKPSERPSMSKVVEMLEGSIQSLQIPPKPYFLESPAAVRSIQESSETSFS